MKRNAKRLLTILLSIVIVMMYTMPGSVFAESPGETVDVYQLVDTLEDGGEYIISNGNSPGSFSALKNPGGTSSGASMEKTTITIEDADGVLSVKEPADDIIWKATANESGFMLTNGADYLEGKGGKIKIFDSCQYADRYWHYSGNQLKHTGGQNTYTLYYDNGFTSTYNETNEKVYFFEKHTENQNTDPIPVESITLDKEEITIEEGKTLTLKATVLPENADDRTVVWTSADTSVASVNSSGVVTGVSAGTTSIEAAAGDITASCAVTVKEKTSTGETTNIGVTSDVHGNVTDLTSWLETVQADYEPDLDSMIYCGDYSYKMNDLEAFVGEFQQIVNITNTIVGEGKGIYTSGNHEYYINNHEIPLDERFTNTPGFVRLGEALVKDNYIVYCMGAASWGNNAVGAYPQEDIDALETYLDSAPADIPILIPAHFPLHFISGRTVTNADKVIDVLNDHPNAIFLWGHNHSHNDTHYGNIVESGGNIEYASGKSKEINFTYACAGGMYQDSQTNYSGVVLSVNPEGKEVVFQYYRARAQIPIGEPKTIHIDGTQVPTHTITASAGPNGTITPMGDITVTEGKSKQFTFKADTGYEIDTLTIDGVVVDDPAGSYTFNNVVADHSINVTFKAKEPGESNYYKLVDSLKANGEYLVVNTDRAGAGYALANRGATSDGTSMASTDVIIEEGDIDNDGTEDKYVSLSSEDTVWTAVNNSNGFDLINDGGYLEGKGGNVKVYSSKQYNDRYWTYTDSYLHYVGGNRTYELYYDGGFTSKSFNSGTGTNKAYIYEKTDSDPEAGSITHTITASAGNNGSITPSGEVTVKEGTDRTFTFTADAGYEIDKVTVDGEEANVEVESYTFTNVNTDHTIHVTFKEAEVIEYIPADSVKNGGSYLLVSNGYALLNDEGVISKIPVQTSEDGAHVYINEKDSEKGISWTMHDSETSETSGDFTIENNGYKLSRVGDGANNPSEITTEEKFSETSGLPYFQWSYDAENTLLTNIGGRDGDSTFYFFYDTSEDNFYTSTTEEKTGLYVLAESEIVWDEPTYEWSSDNTECTAKRVSSDGTVEEKETVTASKDTEAATCLKEGKNTYTAVFENDAFEEQIKTETIPALGHKYKFTGFEWAEDYSTACAVFTCENEASHIYRVNAFVSECTYAPSCETSGRTIHTASVIDFNDGSNHVDVKSFEIPATGHCYTNSRWSWSNDNQQAELFLTCANCGHCERIEAEVETESTEPTCTEDGKYVYTAKAEFNNRYYEADKEVTKPALGHRWKQITKKATFDADGSIYQICSACGKKENIAQIPKAKSIRIENTSYNYTGAKIKPKITIQDSGSKTIENANYDVIYAPGCTNVGKYNVTVKMKGKYSGSKTVSFTIKPQKAAINSVKTGTGQARVTMSKKVGATGGKYYQIEYRIKGESSWKTAKTTAKNETIKNLKKGKIYQIKVRAYKSVNGTTYYGEWSKIKTTPKVK